MTSLAAKHFNFEKALDKMYAHRSLEELTDTGNRASWKSLASIATIQQLEASIVFAQQNIHRKY